MQDTRNPRPPHRGNPVIPKPAAGAAQALTSPRVDAAPVPAHRGMGWYLLLLILAVLALMPFVIAAIVILGG